MSISRTRFRSVLTILGAGVVALLDTHAHADCGLLAQYVELRLESVEVDGVVSIGDASPGKVVASGMELDGQVVMGALFYRVDREAEFYERPNP